MDGERSIPIVYESEDSFYRVILSEKLFVKSTPPWDWRGGWFPTPIFPKGFHTPNWYQRKMDKWKEDVKRTSMWWDSLPWIPEDKLSEAIQKLTEFKKRYDRS